MDTATNYAAEFYSQADNNIEVLKKNVEDFPVSSVARFLLLYHHKINNHPDFESLAKQTAPYLTNPFWMEYQLFQAEDFSQNNSEEFSDSDNGVTEEISLEQAEKDIPYNQVQQELVPESNNQTVEEALPVNDLLEDIPKKGEEENEELISVKNTEEELPAAVNEEIIAISILENKDVDKGEQKNEIEVETHSTIISDEEEKNNDSLKEPEEEKTEEEKSVDQIKIPDVQENDSQKEITNQPAFSEENDEESIPFEPLHTVDYFASQGIKISEEALNDNLGKQVKSFTAWLKSMKKLHPGKLAEQNEVIERLIQASSEVSNQNANVLTEAMAEVLVKQGKQEKAIEMYQKLSLLNPSKSAYFAAKIESLKTV